MNFMDKSENFTAILKIDVIDKQILNILQKDAKMNTKEIAAKIGLSITPTYERIKRLEQIGIIKNYTVILDNVKLGKSLEVFCHVSLSSHSKNIIKKFEKDISEIEDVLECYHITGESDYMLKVLVSSISEYQQFLVDVLSALENVSNVQSSFVMTNVKPKTILTLK